MTGFSDEITASRYVRLTTYRKSGVPVATPVWATWDDDVLTVVTQAPSGKVKRIRNSARVEVAASDWRGTLKSEPMCGVAQVDESEDALDAATARSKARFGIEYAFFDLIAKVRRDTTPKLVLRITAEAAEIANSTDASEEFGA